MTMRTNYPRSGGRAVDYEAIKRNAYFDHGIAIIDLSDSRIAWQDRELVEQICKRLFGTRDGSRK